MAPSYVLRALRRFADHSEREAAEREALVGDGRRLTYAQIGSGVLDVAAHLRDNGVRPGMAVAVLVVHPVEAPVLQLALHLLGCRSVWIDAGALGRELDDYLRLVRVDVLVYDARNRDELGRELAGRLGVAALCLGPGGLGPDLLAARPAGVPAFDPDTATGTPESVFQTSGTTGVPKVVLHTHTLYDQLHVLADELVAAGDPTAVRHLSQTPLWHPAGQIQAMLYLFSGAVLVLASLDGPAEIRAAIERERITSTFVSPPMLYTLLDEPAAGADLSSLTLLSVGAAAVSPARMRQAIDRFGPAMRVTYGLSETPFIAAYPDIAEARDHPDRLRSCGRPYGDVRVRIRDDSGAVLGPDQVGEVWVHSRMNFGGYLGQPELTERTIVDGWLRTNDLGYLDGDGYLYLVARVQDTIITGIGSRCVYPRPIEDVLATHPQVRAAAVIGVPDESFGEVPHAYVVAVDGATVTAEELADLVRAQLNEVWTPRTVEFVDSLPTTGIGKVNTKLLKARHAAGRSADRTPEPA